MPKMMQKAPNVNKFIYCFICISIMSCSSQKKMISQNQVDILNEVLYSSNNNIFYKTINKDLNKSIKDFIINDMEFQFCEKEIILKANEISFLKNQKLEIINLYGLPLISKKKVTRKKKNFETSHISTPLLFRNNTMAVCYTTQRYGGSFILLHKKKSKWKILCSSQVWIE